MFDSPVQSDSADGPVGFSGLSQKLQFLGAVMQANLFWDVSK